MWINQSDINTEFNTQNLTFEYMKKKKFKRMIDYIQFSDFLEIHFDRNKYLKKNYGLSE